MAATKQAKRRAPFAGNSLVFHSRHPKQEHAGIPPKAGATFVIMPQIASDTVRPKRIGSIHPHPLPLPAGEDGRGARELGVREKE